MADLTGGDMSEMLSRLMADEKFMEMAEAVKASLSADADNAEPAPKESAESTEAPPVAGIPKLSPELMSKLPEIMGMLSSSGGKKPNSKMEDRKRLLAAMKPFLSEKRQAAVDSIMNVAGFADLFGL